MARERKGRNVWMKVTDDEIELPVAVADTAAELAKMLHVSENSIYSSMSHQTRGHRKKTPYRKVRITLDDEDETEEEQKMLVERQVIVTWNKPKEQLPPIDHAVVATVSGYAKNIVFDHAMVMLQYDTCGWVSDEYDFMELEVHAWADLEPYKGE